ncbi:histidine phosphotransferase family protein, partial [Vibrio parahaemolyticus]
PSDAMIEQQGFLKTLLNMLIMAEESLAYGGAVTLRSVNDSGKMGCRFEIVGRAAHLSPAHEAAMKGETQVE